MDCILVLGGEDAGELQRSRLALDVYLRCQARDGVRPKMILSGGARVGAGPAGTRECAQMEDFMLRGGVCPDDLVLERLAQETLGNVVFGGVVASEMGLGRIALVTDRFHARRCVALFRRAHGVAPHLLLCTGVDGGLRVWLREWLAWLLLELELRWAGVRRGDMASHVQFLLGRHPLYGGDGGLGLTALWLAAQRWLAKAKGWLSPGG